VRGSRRWLKRRRAGSEWYWRRYGYATEAMLMRWRKARRLSETLFQEALRDAHEGLAERGK
jgi:hypothetical protein